MSQLEELLQNYRDGVPVYLTTGTIVTLGVAAIVVFAVCAFVVKAVKKI